MANATVPTQGQVKSKQVLISELNWKFSRNTQLPQGAANATVTAQLLNGFIIPKLRLNLSFTVTATGATAVFTPANLLGADGWSLIQNLKITINGGQDVRYLTGEQLYWWNVLTGNTPKQGWTFSTTTGPATATFNSTINIPFALPDIYKPLDTCLDARLLGQNAFTINVTYGSTANIIVGSGPTGTTSMSIGAINATVYQDEFASGQGGFAPKVAVLTEQYNSQFTGSVTNNRLPLVGAVANKLYYAFLVNVKTSGNIDDVTGELLSNFQLFSGSNYTIDESPSILQDDWQQSHIGYAPWYQTNGSPLQATGAGKDSPNAWYYIPTVMDGYLHGALDVTDITSLFYALSTTGAANVSVMAITLNS